LSPEIVEDRLPMLAERAGHSSRNLRAHAGELYSQRCWKASLEGKPGQSSGYTGANREGGNAALPSDSLPV
jgi:hypothetical protein